MTQSQLADAVGIRQPTLSGLESSDSEGSSFTVQFARACGVSADWLADEVGEMLPGGLYVTDPKLVAIIKAMEPEPEYVKDAAVQAVLATQKLVTQTRQGTGGSEKNGTED